MNVNMETVEKDYQKARGSWESNYYSQNTYQIKDYFDSSDADYETVANNIGSVALSKYVSFTASQVWPLDGSWITAKGKKGKEAEVEKATSYIRQKVMEGNFAAESHKLIKEGAMYNRGLLTVNWNNGLVFETICNETIYICDETGPSNMRGYADSHVDLATLMERYEGEGVDTILTARKDLKPEDMLEGFTMVMAILPVNKAFFSMETRGKKGMSRYRKEYFVSYGGVLLPIKPIGMSSEEYSSFPILQYLPAFSKSLASQAMPSVVFADQYEQLMLSAARLTLSPPVSLSMDAFTSGNFNLDEGGLTPLNNNERDIKPIITTQGFQITANEIQRHERKVNEIFSLDLIQRATLGSLSQFEVAHNKLSALDAIMPAAVDLMTKVPQILLSRVHKLLKKHDPEYKTLATAAGDIEFRLGGIVNQVQKMRKAAGIARAIQGSSPLFNVDQGSAQNINSDTATRTMWDAWGVGDELNSASDVRREREAQAKAQQEMMKQKQALEQAKINQKGQGQGEPGQGQGQL